MVEHDESMNEPYHQGVYVDIFIYDFYPRWALNISKVINKCQDIRKLRRNYPKDSAKRHLFNFACLPVTLFYSIFKIIVSWILEKTIYKVRLHWERDGPIRISLLNREQKYLSTFQRGQI